MTAIAGLLSVVYAGQVAQARREFDGVRRDLDVAKEAIFERRYDDAYDALTGAERSLRKVKRDAGTFPFGMLAPLPAIGSPSKALDHAAGAALDVVDAGRILVDAARDLPTSGTKAIDGHDLSEFHAAAEASTVDLERARERLVVAQRKLDGPAGAFLPALSQPARAAQALIDDVAAQLGHAHDGLDLLADLTDPGTDARLLVLSQDTMELRATGGFIGSYGILHFERGTVALEEYDSFEALDSPEPPMEPPAELEPALRRPWDLSNVNWWPDFPTSAEKAREMFRRQRGVEVDGVIALTEHVMADLVGVFGPIEVPGYEKPVTKEGFAERVLYEVELKRPLDVPRKRFLIELSEIVFDRLFTLEGGDVPEVADAVAHAIGAGDVQLWFADPARQARLEGGALSGALPRTERDFLMLVDANLTASKANQHLVRDATYTVGYDDDLGRYLAKLEVQVANEGAETPVNRYYNGFLRVYVPEGVTLASVETPPRDHGPAPDGPYRVLSRALFVRPGESQTVTFEYVLPASVAPGGDYGLTWVRQAGTPADHLTAVIGSKRVTAPPGERTLRVGHRLERSGLRAWLHDRWLFRKLGL